MAVNTHEVMTLHVWQPVKLADHHSFASTLGASEVNHHWPWSHIAREVTLISDLLTWDTQWRFYVGERGGGTARPPPTQFFSG